MMNDTHGGLSVSRLLEMQMAPDEVEVYLVMSLKRSMLGCIPNSLRAIKYRIEGENITVICIADCRLSENEAEAISCAHTETLTDFIHTHVVEFETHVIPMPAALTVAGRWFFQRYETSD